MALYEHDSIATIPDLHGVTKVPTAQLVRHSTKHAPPGDGVSAYLCNFLDDYGVNPVKVLKKAGLRTETQAASSPLSLILTLTLVRPESFLCLLWGRYRDCFHVFLSLCVILRLHTWRARRSQLLSATRTQFWLHLTFIADVWTHFWLHLTFIADV
jgi:hypothetical protein